ncbi:MAG: hypothetical protein FJ261_00195 [Planctomycetes bacterium]|nr:hypothetical protein [Planctomycetota bacterium]
MQAAAKPHLKRAGGKRIEFETPARSEQVGLSRLPSREMPFFANPGAALPEEGIAVILMNLHHLLPHHEEPRHALLACNHHHPALPAG